MRTLLITPDFLPNPNSTARLFTELAEDLVVAEHAVTVITRQARGARRRWRTHREETRAGLIYRMPPTPLPRRMPSARAIDQIAMASAFYYTGRRLARHDAILVYSPPQPLVVAGSMLARRWNCPLVVNVQDIYPQTGIDLGLLSGPALSASRWLEGYLQRHARVITVYSEEARDFLIGSGASPERVHIIPNWVDLDQVRDVPRDEGWLAEHGLSGRFVVSFAGTMGFAQGLDSLVEAAKLLEDVPQLVVVLAGGGVLRPRLEERVRSLGLTNVRFLPTLDEADYLTLLSSSDVNIVSLDERLAVPVMPGKLQMLMAAARPIVGIANPATGLKRVIDESGCGLFVHSGNPAALADSIRTLLADRDRASAMGKAGRSYAELHYRRGDGTGAYDRLLRELVEHA